MTIAQPPKPLLHIFAFLLHVITRNYTLLYLITTLEGNKFLTSAKPPKSLLHVITRYYTLLHLITTLEGNKFLTSVQPPTLQRNMFLNVLPSL